MQKGNSHLASMAGWELLLDAAYRSQEAIAYGNIVMSWRIPSLAPLRMWVRFGMWVIDTSSGSMRKIGVPGRT